MEIQSRGWSRLGYTRERWMLTVSWMYTAVEKLEREKLYEQESKVTINIPFVQ